MSSILKAFHEHQIEGVGEGGKAAAVASLGLFCRESNISLKTPLLSDLNGAVIATK